MCNRTFSCTDVPDDYINHPLQIDQVFAKILKEGTCPSIQLRADVSGGDWISATDVEKAFAVAREEGAVAASRTCTEDLIVIDEVRGLAKVRTGFH